MNDYFKDITNRVVFVGDIIAHHTRNGQIGFSAKHGTTRLYVVEAIEDSGDGKYRKVKVRGWFRNGWSKSSGCRTYVRLVKRTYGCVRIDDLSQLDITEPCTVAMIQRHRELVSKRGS